MLSVVCRCFSERCHIKQNLREPKSAQAAILAMSSDIEEPISCIVRMW